MHRHTGSESSKVHFARTSVRYCLRSHCLPKRTRCVSRLAAKATAAEAGKTHEAISLHQYDDFELLWLEYRHELSLSKEAALWTLEDVQRGVLPCDADLLKERAQQFTALSQHVPKLDTRRLLNVSRSFLLYDSR